MLNRDLVGFSRVTSAIEGLLRVHWETLNPRGDGDGFELRAAVLQTLEDNPTVILPLQHLPLFQSRRYGFIDFRALMIADGESRPAVPSRDLTGWRSSEPSGRPIPRRCRRSGTP